MIDNAPWGAYLAQSVEHKTLNLSHEFKAQVGHGAYLKTNKQKKQGRLGSSMVEHLPLAQGVIPGSWDRSSHQAPCRGLNKKIKS